MAFLNKAHILSHLPSYSQKSDNSFAKSSRGYHIDLGNREISLLAKDPALSKFKSHKQDVKRIKRIGGVLTVIVVAGCCHEMYVRATVKEEARKLA